MQSEASFEDGGNADSSDDMDYDGLREYLEGQFKQTRAIRYEMHYRRVLPGGHKSLFVESNPIPVKWALHRMGRIDAGIRLPLTPLAREHHDTLAAALRGAGCIH